MHHQNYILITICQTHASNVTLLKEHSFTAYRGSDVKSIFLDMVHYITKLKIPCLPKLCVLGIYPGQCITKKNDLTLIDLCLLQVKRLIAVEWKKRKIYHHVFPWKN